MERSIKMSNFIQFNVLVLYIFSFNILLSLVLSSPAFVTVMSEIIRVNLNLDFKVDKASKRITKISKHFFIFMCMCSLFYVVCTNLCVMIGLVTL